MWSGPLHDPEFVAEVLAHVETNEDKYGTAPRMKGMLTVAKEVSSINPAARRLPRHRPAHGEPRRNWTCRSTSRRRGSRATSTASAPVWTRPRQYRVIFLVGHEKSG